MRKNELLVPASSLEVLKNCSYLWSRCGLHRGRGIRTQSQGKKNFTMEEMAEGIAFAHARELKFM